MLALLSKYVRFTGIKGGEVPPVHRCCTGASAPAMKWAWGQQTSPTHGSSEEKEVLLQSKPLFWNPCLPHGDAPVLPPFPCRAEQGRSSWV